MKILMTADAVGGVWTYSLELARALRRQDAEVTLATMGRALTGVERREASAIPSLRLAESEFALEWMPDPWDDVERAGEWLLRLEAEVEPDVVHLNGYVHAALPWKAPVLVVGHSCVLSWFAAVRGLDAPPGWGRYADEVRDALAHADFLVAPTRAMLSELERLYEPSCERQVIPNGRDPRLFPPRPKEPFVFASGRLWDEAKNLAALDRVASRLDWPVRVAGDAVGPDGSEWRAEAVDLVGRVSHAELARLLGAAAVFALPARYEPFGLGPLEAGLAGCALLLGDIASLRETWRDAAVFVDPDDDEALAAALRRLPSDERAREELSRRARAPALTYSPERTDVAYHDLYALLSASTAVGSGRAS